MQFELFTPLFAKIDQLGVQFIAQVSSRMVTELTPVISIGLTFSFIIYSLLIIQGLVEMPVMAFLTKSLRIVIILAIASAGGFYQTHLAALICALPDAAAQVLISHNQSGQGAACLIDQAGDRGLQCVSEAFSKAGLFKNHGVIYAVMGTIALISTIALLSIGGSFILMSKVALTLLAGVGPLFIMLMVFNATQRLFTLWLGQVTHYILLLVLYAAVFGLLMDMFSGFMEQLALDGVQNIGLSLGGAAILAYSMIIIVRQLPSIAGALAGEVSLNYNGLTSALKAQVQQRVQATHTRLQQLTHKHPALSAVTAPIQRVLSHNYFKGSLK